jgi:DNA-binding NarL/FixJ family response regulator
MNVIERTRVAIVEDDTALVLHLRQVIEQSSDFKVAWIAHSLQDARSQMTRPTDLVLLDLGLPDGRGISLVPQLRALPQPPRIIAFTVFSDEANVVDAVEAGIDAYVLKDIDRDALFEALAQTRDGASPISPAVARYLLRRMRRSEPAAATPESALTGRERDVLERLARGYSYRETAEQLGISANTVAHHIKNIYPKLAVGSRGEAVFRAVQDGLISLDR